MARFTGSAAMLVVRDVDETAAWFGRALGFEVQFAYRDHGPGDDEVPDGPEHQHTGPATFAMLLRDGLRVMVSRSEDGKPRLNGTTDVYFWAEGLDELWVAARAAGGEVGPTEVQPYGVREFRCRTPEGQLVTVGELVSEG